MDNRRINLSCISAIINVPFDHVAQIVQLKIDIAAINKFLLKQRTRLIDSETIINFKAVLKEKKGGKKKPGNLFL